MTGVVEIFFLSSVGGIKLQNDFKDLFLYGI